MRHNVTLEPDGRCLLCQDGIPEDSKLRQLIKTLVVLTVIAVSGISYLVCRVSGDEAPREFAVGQAEGVPITMYMADW